MDNTSFIPCFLRELPPEEQVQAAAEAIRINPMNAPVAAALPMVMNGLVGITPNEVILPDHLALLTSKYWGSNGVRLTVSFMDNPPSELRAKIISHMNAWNKTANVIFVETGSGGQVRIARTPGQGYYSYLGTDILRIPANQQTMNLDSFTLNTPDSEFYRVVRHETGHTLGMIHEHMRRQIVARLDVNKTILYFQRTQGWSAQTTRQQVLTPIEEVSLRASPNADIVSIMCYQLPGEITIDGLPIVGGNDIDSMDYEFVGSFYPKPNVPQPPVPEKPKVTFEIDCDNFKGVKVLP